MVLLTIRTAQGPRLGVKTSLGIIDVIAAAEKLSVAGVPGSVLELARGGDPARQALELLVDRALTADAGAAPWLLTEESVIPGPSVPQPGKIVCIGLNYRSHAEETKSPIPATPVVFGKFGNAIAATNDPIPLPRDGEQFDYEAELAIVIGRQAYNVDAATALDHVFGYCCANDVSCRDLQRRTPQWMLGKCFDGWCPVGPYVVTADEVGDAGSLAVRSYVNGELRQNGNTRDLIFPIEELIAYVSRYMTLEPGDLILTGTPAGVAAGRPDKPWLKPGDEVIVEVEKLGRLRNVVGERK